MRHLLLQKGNFEHRMKLFVSLTPLQLRMILTRCIIHAALAEFAVNLPQHLYAEDVAGAVFTHKVKNCLLAEDAFRGLLAIPVFHYVAHTHELWQNYVQKIDEQGLVFRIGIDKLESCIG